MIAQGMSAGTAKTPKVVEGEARQPGSEGMRPMTNTAKPLPEEAVTDAVWERLKELCCSDPEKAKRCVMVSEEQFRLAMRAATQPTAMPEEEVMRIVAEALKPYRYHMKPGENAHLWLARRCADEIAAALSTPIPLKPKVDEDAEKIEGIAEWLFNTFEDHDEPWSAVPDDWVVKPEYRQYAREIAARLEDGK